MSPLLHDLLSESAARDPSHMAVVGSERSLTYGELDALSNQLARELIDAGVRPGDRVGLFMQKCPEGVAALFAAQKAGAAYVPIDPHAPPRRAAYILGNCGVTAILGSAEKIGKLPDEYLASPELKALILLEDDAKLPEAASANRLLTSFHQVEQARSKEAVNVPVTDNHLAYILYTSGSTGEPKGVMISHLNSLTFVNWCFDTFEVKPSDRVSNHAPFHFDLSVFDIFCTIKAGATLYLVPGDLAIFPGKLTRWIAQNELSIWYSVPSALIQLLEHGRLRAEDFPKLRTVLFAGEVFPMKYLRRLVEALPHPEYYNLYGPTETNVCTFYKVKADDLEASRTEPVPIGAACKNTEVFAMTDGGHAGAVGEEGELYVRSSTVMKGYWGRPEDSARFLVPNTQNPHYAELVYRTGDIVRLMPSGDYQYLGRKDKMIKSRGYRIEIGEIEAAFHAHPGVKEIAVIAVPDDEIGARIHAFVAVTEGTTRGALERFCAERIPRYMMPEKLTFQEELPKTSTGKIDKALLERRTRSDEHQ